MAWNQGFDVDGNNVGELVNMPYSGKIWLVLNSANCLLKGIGNF